MEDKNKDIRWEQRFSNFRKALNQLKTAIDILDEFDEEDKEIAGDNEEITNAILRLNKVGLIHRFEYTHELAWNVMKDYAEYQGNNTIKGTRDAIREAFAVGLISNADIWMDMIKSRNDTLHTYNEEIAEKIYIKIIKEYYPLFNDFNHSMRSFLSGSTFLRTNIVDNRASNSALF